MGYFELYHDVGGVWQAPGRSADPPPPPPPEPTIISVNDFLAANSSGFWMPAGAVGDGMDLTVYQVNANSTNSTTVNNMNALVKGQTNPNRIMKGGSTNSGTPTTGLVFSDFTIKGLPQGMNFGGLDLLYANSPQVNRVKITGCQGSAAGPPGETFSLHTQRTNNPLITDVVLDGRDQTGVPIAATLNGNSYLVNGGTWTRVIHQYAQYGFGTAIFQASGTSAYTWTDCQWLNCRKAFNLEDALTPGPYIFNRPVFSPTLGTGQGEVMQISSKTSSAQVRIYDPVLTGGLTFPLKLRWYPASGTQVASDIQLFIGGVEKTNDPTKLQLVHY